MRGVAIFCFIMGLLSLATLIYTVTLMESIKDIPLFLYGFFVTCYGFVSAKKLFELNSETE